MLLHGWLVTADLNWGAAYGPLIEAGYRLLAIDHRGHRRGLRPLVPVARPADLLASRLPPRRAPSTVWVHSELMRQSARDMAEAAAMVR
jgi:pimeloyl-ACP methyl ester carboxylesterase